MSQALYFIYKQKALVESGQVSFQQALQDLLVTSAQARQQRTQGATDAAILAQQGGRLRGQYQPTAHFWYDEKGQLIKATTGSLKDEPTTSRSQGSMAP